MMLLKAVIINHLGAAGNETFWIGTDDFGKNSLHEGQIRALRDLNEITQFDWNASIKREIGPRQHFF